MMKTNENLQHTTSPPVTTTPNDVQSASLKSQQFANKTKSLLVIRRRRLQKNPQIYAHPHIRQSPAYYGRISPAAQSPSCVRYSHTSIPATDYTLSHMNKNSYCVLKVGKADSYHRILGMPVRPMSQQKLHSVELQQ